VCATEGVARSREENDQAFLERNLALLGLIDLSTGDYAAAAERLAPVVRRRQARGAGEPSLYPARELAIEALVAVGDLDEARVQLEWLEEAGRRLGTPWPLALGARCRGLLQAAEGDLEAALVSCERALEVHERMPSPFERARTLLIYGTILRRIKRRKAAREAIEAALSIFEALPAPVWADNARAELARRPCAFWRRVDSERAANRRAGRRRQEQQRDRGDPVHQRPHGRRRAETDLPQARSPLTDRAVAPPQRRLVEQRPLISGLSPGRRWT
jgi:tetratricopeptide (TPR) repeat protein